MDEKQLENDKKHGDKINLYETTIENLKL